MRVKLIVAPYYFYNAYMPPLGIALVAAALNEHGIRFDMEDLYIRLYHELRRDKIDISAFLDQDRVLDFIRGGAQEDIRRETEKIMSLTDFSGYTHVCFSGHYPPLNMVPRSSIVMCLIHLVRKKFHPIIVTNFRIHNDEQTNRLVDFATERIDHFIQFLKTRETPRRLTKNFKAENHLLVKPFFEKLPLKLYKFDAKTEIAEFIKPKPAVKCNLKPWRHVLTKSIPLLLPYHFVTGCQTCCAFCKFSSQPSCAIKDPDEVACDLGMLRKKYDTNSFMFLNTNINPTKQAAANFAKSVIKNKLKISFTDCANFWNLDEDLLKQLKAAGAIRLVFGFESASLKIQKSIGKVIRLDHITKILKTCYHIGIWTEIDLLVGLPHEEAEDIIATLEFIKENYLYLRNINLNIFILKRDSLMHTHPSRYRIDNVKRDPDYDYGYDEIHGFPWGIKKPLTQYRYQRFLACLHPHKINYFRPSQFVFMLNRHFKNAGDLNHYLDKKFFSGHPHAIDDFIDELRTGKDIEKVLSSKKNVGMAA